MLQAQRSQALDRRFAGGLLEAAIPAALPTGTFDVSEVLEQIQQHRLQVGGVPAQGLLHGTAGHTDEVNATEAGQHHQDREQHQGHAHHGDGHQEDADEGQVQCRQGHRACEIGAQTLETAQAIRQGERRVALQLGQAQEQDLLQDADAQQQVQLRAEIGQASLAPLGQPELQQYSRDREGEQQEKVSDLPPGNFDVVDSADIEGHDQRQQVDQQRDHIELGDPTAEPQHLGLEPLALLTGPLRFKADVVGVIGLIRSAQPRQLLRGPHELKLPVRLISAQGEGIVEPLQLRQWGSLAEAGHRPAIAEVGEGVHQIHPIHRLGGATDGIAQLNRLTGPVQGLQQIREQAR